MKEMGLSRPKVDVARVAETQGGVLSPLLWLCYSNDLASVL